jgi:hypothetical protein
MHIGETLANDRLQNAKENVNVDPTVIIGKRGVKEERKERKKSKRTPPGINSPDITAPSGGTTRGWPITPGNMRRPSFVTAACNACGSTGKKDFFKF